jgi:hypothetical protein
MWRRLLGAYSAEAGQCFDAAKAVLSGDELVRVINCALNWTVTFDGTDLVGLFDAIPGALERAASSASGTAMYGFLVQSARDNPSALRQVALSAAGLKDLHALGRLRDHSSGIVYDFRITSLSAFEALYRFSNTGVREVTTRPNQRKWQGVWDGPYGKLTGTLYFADTGYWTIQFSPCPAFLSDIMCGNKQSYKIRFDSLD